MKFLVFGSLNIDLTFSLDHITREGETASASHLKKSAGGKGANQAAALAKAGLPVWMAGTIGQDGRFITRLLESYGVNTDMVREYEGETGQAIIQVDKRGQNAIVIYAGGNSEISEAQAEETLSRFGAGDTVVLQNEIPLTSFIMKGAREREIRIALNPSPFDEHAQTLPIGDADLLFVNEIEGAALVNIRGGGGSAFFLSVLETLTARFPRTEIILTAGEYGAYYGFKDTRIHAPAAPIAAVDTTGAGDTFLGYFLAARELCPAEQALKTACKAASITVSRRGAMEAIPTAGEVSG